MNPQKTNPLIRELARGRAAEPHPDTDVLAAFAENDLAGAERTSVMEHLAVCAICREVVQLSSAAMPDAAVEREMPAAKRWPRIWMPWLATAAGILVIGSAVAVHVRNAGIHRLKEKPAINMAKVETPAPPPPPAKLPERQMQVSRAREPLQDRVPATVRPPALQERIGDGSATNAYAGNNVTALSDQLTPVAPVPPPAQQQASVTNVPQAGTAQAVAVPLESMNGIAATGKTSKELKMNRAAAAAPDAGVAGNISGGAAEFGGRFGLIGVRAHWRINEAGKAERSLGTGPWEPVGPDGSGRMRVVAVSGSQVWLGGDQLRLYRSGDNGTTWRPVPLPRKDTKAQVIAHIRFLTATTVTVEADDGTQWTTQDGGLTWK